MNKEQPEALQLPTLPFAVFDEFGQPCEDRVRDHFAAAFEELRAQIGHGVSDGWQLVPKEPTPEMCAIDFDCDDSIGIDSARICYKTMLASAPPAPQQKPLTDEQITAGAKALCKRSSELFGVNADDNWNLESEYFKDDARCVLEAAHGIGKKK